MAVSLPFFLPLEQKCSSKKKLSQVVCLSCVEEWSIMPATSSFSSHLSLFPSHLSPLFTWQRWQRKMEGRKLCSVGHLVQTVWNWNEHDPPSTLFLQKKKQPLDLCSLFLSLSITFFLTPREGHSLLHLFLHKNNKLYSLAKMKKNKKTISFQNLTCEKCVFLPSPHSSSINVCL